MVDFPVVHHICSIFVYFPFQLRPPSPSPCQVHIYQSKSRNNNEIDFIDLKTMYSIPISYFVTFLSLLMPP